MSCCDPIEYEQNDIDGECPDCGNPTVDGDAFDQCSFSECKCDTCGYAPCDLSC